MIDVVVNPEGIEATYLECVNRCFDDWGGSEEYRWAFHRRVGDLSADIMILKKDGQILAGSAVTYRKVLLANDSLINVGIMTGSWTLPEARRQGCFTRIIQESLTLASQKGAALLLAFVTEKNASYCRLANAGSALFPTYYLFSKENMRTPLSDYTVAKVTDQKHVKKMIIDRLNRKQAGYIRFTYMPDEWQAQFLERPEKIEVLTINTTSFAIIEKKGDFDRVLMLSLGEETTFTDCLAALLQETLGHQRKLFLFTTSQTWKDELLRLGFGYVPGYLTTLAANKQKLRNAFGVEASFPEDTEKYLYNPYSPGFLGTWDIHSGDRM